LDRLKGVYLKSIEETDKIFGATKLSTLKLNL